MYKDESDKRIRRKSNSWELRITWLDGKQFNSASECSKYCGIKDKVLRSYLSRSRRMPKELYDRGLRYNDYSMNDYEYFQK
jgi:hypothetical protein